MFDSKNLDFKMVFKGSDVEAHTEVRLRHDHFLEIGTVKLSIKITQRIQFGACEMFCSIWPD